ncbi:YggT family protein [Lactobacillus gigeriorum]|uniref:Cell division membrane protein n=2 Tax=Lactobacillus gigeriorum DSM 23908 = CRBIP 24.85 TaxID=1423751 RepID=I7K113_9LACO|nr:YggT family protein [Lactobacillus gigeriorum]CCI87190.1 Cell division membrane protein [Lactobacillus gigeriorum DSM 23908 = CRBIP 24.85]
MVAYYVVITLQYILWLYSIFIVIDAIMSWLPFLANSTLGRLLDKIVDPYLNLFRQGPIRKLAFATGIDVSAVIGLFILYFIQNYALNWLFNILYKILG